MKVAILYICTGAYNIFWEEFYKSFEKNFLPNLKKEYFVFTDADEIYAKDERNVHVLEHQYLGWPYDTLMRFEVFLRVENQLRDFEYTFFFNANMICKQIVNENEFLQLENKNINLIMVKHPGTYLLKAKYFPYERNTNSTAYIPYNKGKYYVMGALNGGKTVAYLELIHFLRNNTNIDLNNGVIARVHDESHLNRYILNRNDYFVLSPAFCNAEVYELPFEKKIVMLDKSRFFDVDRIKSVKAKERKVHKIIRRSFKFIKCNTMQIIDNLRRKQVG